MISKRTTIWLTILILLTVSSASAENILTNPPERRTEQFPTESGRLFLPLPYSLPGIGSGYFLMGYFTNIFNTTADAFIIKVIGDAEGYVAQLDEIPLYRRNLLLNIYEQQINKAAVNNYKTRGMKNGKKDYNIIEVNQANERNIGLTLSLYDRRLEFNSTSFSSEVSITNLREPNGSLIRSLDPPFHMEDAHWRHSVRMDFTDDYLDSRKGVNFNIFYQNVPGDTQNDPDYYLIDGSASVFIPVRNSDTLAFNLYRSTANVTRTGNTDPAAIRQELGLNCPPTDSVCITAEQELVNTFVAMRTNGTATHLGGENRLRGYPRGRFSGGQMAFVGTEYRWNFVREAKPFDYFIWKDITTGLQLAFFYEVGTVEETSSDLWKDYRSSYGVGGRLVSASGSVYRADVAFSDEGSQLAIFFFYPWK